MTIDTETSHLRMRLRLPGVKFDRVAKAAGVSWDAVRNIASGIGDPKESTLLAVERGLDRLELSINPATRADGHVGDLHSSQPNTFETDAP
jgi:hypothetical protein